jgi:hypothetical protein
VVQAISFFKIILAYYLLIPVAFSGFVFFVSLTHNSTERCNGTRYIKGCDKKVGSSPLREVFGVFFALLFTPFWYVYFRFDQQRLAQKFDSYASWSYLNDHHNGQTFYSCRSCWKKSEETKAKKDADAFQKLQSARFLTQKKALCDELRTTIDQLEFAPSTETFSEVDKLKKNTEKIILLAEQHSFRS